MRCVVCPSEGGRPSSMDNSLLGYGQPCFAAPLSKDSAPSSGPSNAWALSSNVRTAFALARRRSGASWARWASACKNRSSGLSSATRRSCEAGSAVPGQPSKKSPAGRPADRFCGRGGHQRASHPHTHLGTQGADAHYPVSLQLESRLGHRRPYAHQLPVQAARGQHQEGRDRRISHALKVHLKQPLLVIWDGMKAHRSRLVHQYFDSLNGHIQIGFLPPYAPDMNPVEISVGLTQKTRAGQRLPQRFERVASDRAQQAQECSKTPLDHRRLLEASHTMVTS